MKNIKSLLHLDEFVYDLPEGLIAQYPLRERDQARLMVVDRRKGKIAHDTFANIGSYLAPASCLVLNESKVIPARLLGRREKTPGRVEVFLLKKLPDGYSYETLLRPRTRLRPNETISFNGGSLTAEIVDKDRGLVRFNKKNITRMLERYGHMPLPPYIRRGDEPMDREYYQTVYARRPGSVASPTAGLHFTPSLLSDLRRKGHTIEKVTLHVNYGTFKSVQEEDITRHRMHAEEYALTRKAFHALQQAPKEGRKIVAVGTTSCRVMETVARHQSAFNSPVPIQGNTDIFIYPGYTFRMTGALITNFHLPRSTLLMLVYAFGGMDLMRRAYAEAMERQYRFYSYGDAMIIL
jgi:S-adenosylmethionine:tRNA ribosyltransferase-isomerase